MADSRPFTVHDLDNRPVIATREQARDFGVYQRLRAEAQRRNVPLQIVSDAEFADPMGDDSQPAPRRARPETDGTIELGGRRVYPIRESDARDFQAYVAGKDKAAALGVSLEIVADDAFVQSATSPETIGQGVHISADGTKCWQIPRSLTRDIQKYEAAKVRAAEQGLDLLIVPDDDSAA